ncbi:hypothetical protein ACQW02_18765 [Humitalea sp. 24SJ18S-53]|uniref:hypothetical protein n=1 Tax=Humitalea sp. 24SJ18S-53 TaxID=3422307 RepID=UPI003D670809
MLRSMLLATAAVVALAGAAQAADPAPANNPAVRAIDRAAGTNLSGAYPLQSDGMPGNPSGTAVGRALDRGAVTAQAANPPGTAVGRAIDRAAGTNQSGAYPLQSDGMPGNPPGTAVGRALDGAAATVAPSTSNPPGTAAGRAIDRAAGTNQSGAYPAQSDGTRANPPGTAVGRALEQAAPASGPPATGLPSGRGTN